MDEQELIDRAVLAYCRDNGLDNVEIMRRDSVVDNDDDIIQVYVQRGRRVLKRYRYYPNSGKLRGVRER